MHITITKVFKMQDPFSIHNLGIGNGVELAFPVVRVLIMRGRKTLKTGKAWDETSRGDRRRVPVD